MEILYINADFDEHELETKRYTSLEEFTCDRIGINYSLTELREMADDPEGYPDEAFIYELITSGCYVGEWSTEEVWFIKDGKFSQGLL